MSGQLDAKLLHSRKPQAEDCQSPRRLDEDFKGIPEALPLSGGHPTVFAELLKTLPGKPFA